MKQTWTRREWLQTAAFASAGVTLGAHGQTAPGPSAQVMTPLGAVRGFSSMDGVRVFRGVPFAQPPVGPLRFRAPVPVRAWTGVKDATRFGPAAMQPDRKDAGENCLYLNVFAPPVDGASRSNGPFPVFIWIHGGGYTGGSPSDAIFDGTGFAKRGIVVVTIAYRLGVFGFLDWSPLLGPEYADSANNALRDLVSALRWVHTNITGFGGDPSRVTVGGESAGAKLTGTLMAMDEARPLFQSMISESGGGERIRTQVSSVEVSKIFAAQLGDLAGHGTDPRTAGPEALLKAQKMLIDAWGGNFPLRPESGGELLPNRALPPIAQGSTRDKRLLIGTNRDESALFLGDHAAAPLSQRNLGNITLAQFEPVFSNYRKLYPQMTPAQLNIRALTAEEYWMPSMRLAAAHCEGGGKTWCYRLDEEAASGRFQGEAYHSFDLGFVWERLSKSEPDPAQHLSMQMHDAWAAFIKGGAPAAASLPPWPQWNPETRLTVLLNNTSTVEQQPFEPEFHLWDGFRFD